MCGNPPQGQHSSTFFADISIQVKVGFSLFYWLTLLLFLMSFEFNLFERSEPVDARTACIPAVYLSRHTGFEELEGSITIVLSSHLQVSI
jgi:hypothetical protein